MQEGTSCAPPLFDVAGEAGWAAAWPPLAVVASESSFIFANKREAVRRNGVSSRLPHLFGFIFGVLTDSHDFKRRHKCPRKASKKVPKVQEEHLPRTLLNCLLRAPAFLFLFPLLNGHSDIRSCCKGASDGKIRICIKFYIRMHVLVLQNSTC